MNAAGWRLYGNFHMFYFNNRTSHNGVRERVATMHRRLSLSCVVLAAGLGVSAGDAHAITQCQGEKGAGYPWAWRQIDGKRCWYKGQAGMDKKLLRWAENTKAPAEPKRSPSIVVGDRADREFLLHSYWPRLPQADAFDDRFDAARAKRQ